GAGGAGAKNMIRAVMMPVSTIGITTNARTRMMTMTLPRAGAGCLVPLRGGVGVVSPSATWSVAPAANLSHGMTSGAGGGGGGGGGAMATGAETAIAGLTRCGPDDGSGGAVGLGGGGTGGKGLAPEPWLDGGRGCVTGVSFCFTAVSASPII